MFHKFIKASVIISSMMIGSLTWAEQTPLAQSTTVEILSENPSSQGASEQELAVLYVIAEICPSLIEQKDLNAFHNGYEKFSQEYLEHSNALSYIQNLSKQSHFQPALQEALSDAKNAGDVTNREICHELMAYQAN